MFATIIHCLFVSDMATMLNTAADELQDCEDGKVRLIGGRNNEEGLLSVCNQKVWGTICSNDWDNDNDATVACRQLGFQRSGRMVHKLYMLRLQIFLLHSSTEQFHCSIQLERAMVLFTSLTSSAMELKSPF